MIPKVTIVVLAKYVDIFIPFQVSVQNFAPGVPCILVRDGHDIPDPEGWAVVQGPEKFSMAGNANLGLKAVPADSDVLYCGDDIRFLHLGDVQTLRDIAMGDPSLGILSPKIIGGVNNKVQNEPPEDQDITYASNLCFPCVYIKRQVIDEIGYLDERFGSNYGWDDDEYVLRTVRAGFNVGVTPRVNVRHLCQQTFLRNNAGNPFALCEQMERNFRLFMELSKQA